MIQIQRPWPQAPAPIIIDTQEKADAHGFGALFREMNVAPKFYAIPVVEQRRLSLKQRGQVSGYRESLRGAP